MSNTLRDIQKALVEIQEFTGNPNYAVEVSGGKARLVVTVGDIVSPCAAWRDSGDEFLNYMADMVANARRLKAERVARYGVQS